jgi:L-amino acid N-acyltransferase YncA
MILPEIRSVKETDIDQVIELCELHARFENAEYDNTGKAIKLGRALFRESPSLYCLVAEQNKKIVGYARAC